jgi:hypothetical protein
VNMQNLSLAAVDRHLDFPNAFVVVHGAGSWVSVFSCSFRIFFLFLPSSPQKHKYFCFHVSRIIGFKCGQWKRKNCRAEYSHEAAFSWPAL